MLTYHQLLSQEVYLDEARHAYALVSKDTPTAMQQLEALAGRGSILAMIYLAQAYRVGRYADPAKEESWFKAAYERGSLSALTALGISYIRQNRMEEAEALLAQGEKEDDGISIYYLSQIYLRRAKSAEDFLTVKRMLERSMELGQVRAKNTLGRMLIQNFFGLKHIPRGVFLHMSSLSDALRIGIKDPDDPRLW